MGKVVIDLAEAVELRLEADNLADAIEKLIDSNNKADKRSGSLAKFRGIARYKELAYEKI